VGLGDDFGTKFREVGVAEFFRKNLHMLGYSGPIKSFTTAIHEYVTNAIDACEEYGIAPEIKVQIKETKDGGFVVAVEDNGPGIPPEYVPKVFGSMLSGTKFHRYIQSRGQQGIGAAGVILFSQMTTGKPTKVISSTGQKAAVVFLKIDADKNVAKVLDESRVDVDWHGTKLVSEFQEVTYRRGEQSAYEYLRRTAIANPHAKITFIEPTKEKTVWKRSVTKTPARPKEMLPHPLGVTPDDLVRMASVATNSKTLLHFLKTYFSRVSANKAKEILAKAKVEENREPAKLTYQEAVRIVAVFPKVKLLSPPTDGLIPIEEDSLTKSLEDTLKPEFLQVITRKPTTYRGGIPFQIEAAVAYGGGAGRTSGDGDKLEIMRFANKTPLLFDAGACAIHQAVKDINWKNYNIGDIDNAPVTVVVNLLSPYVPYMSAGKQAVAQDPDVVKEIRFAVMAAGRGVKKYMAGVRREKLKQKRRSIFIRYAPEVAWAINKITGTPEEKVLKKLTDTIEHKVRLKNAKDDADAEDAENGGSSGDDAAGSDDADDTEGFGGED